MWKIVEVSKASVLYIYIDFRFKKKNYLGLRLLLLSLVEIQNIK